MTTVTISVVLHQSADDIVACLKAIDRQRRPPDAVVVLDNASTDGGLDLARQALPAADRIRRESNIGFAAGQNVAMDLRPADIHVVLNPDCQLAPSFLDRAVDALDRDPRAGSVTGRLLRFRDQPDWQPAGELPDDVLDSTGMVALRNRRVLDRGSEESSAGRYLTDEYVFGASGAAAVYRRAMLEDVAFRGQYFDEAFFAYREDVDLAWRAQHLAWRCRYVPGAVARHRRRVAPGRRGHLPGWINRMSLANRWRMIAKNETTEGWLRDWPAIATRDLLTLGYCALREQASLLAVADVMRSRGLIQEWRRDLWHRRRADPREVLRWFGRITGEAVTARE